ncbi:MAG: DDE-type integrase/transposase/recombinase [Oscillospiraceae bacterium]|nr:DDE-type integrase/transposase/recombinase [Oscillospiraceae bacterium]
MTQEEKHAIALMRYAAITPLINGTKDEFQSLSSFFKEAALKPYPAADGSMRHFSPAAIERWYRCYLKSGFDALLPKGRSDSGKSRALDDDCQEYIRHMKTRYPRLPAAAIYRQMLQEGLISKNTVSESSVNRFVNRVIEERNLPQAKDMRRYERAHINEVWCGDSSAGPRLLTDGAKKKVFIIALIDDASRFVTSADVFFNDTFVNLMSVMKSAVSRYGRPKIFNFDNGSAYKNKQMELLAARIGCAVSYCKPYTPTAKAKIERWFRTLKDQWMASLDMDAFQSLEQLRASLDAFVDSYNHTPHASLSGQSPIDRFFAEPDQVRRLDRESIDHSFLLEVDRTVSADSVVVIDRVEYQVDCRFAKQRIKLRYSPDLAEIFVVGPDGALIPIRLLDKKANSNAKREKLYLSGGEA